MRRRSVDTDTAAIRSAALRTGVQVAAVSAALVMVVLLLAVAFIVTHSKPTELLVPRRDGVDRIYVDADDLLIFLVVVGLIGIAMVGVAGWAISRRSVTPLAVALGMQRAFVADASHELRTPLTVLDTRVQLLQRRLDRGEPWRATSDELRRDVRGMIDLVTDLLLLAEESATTLPPEAATPTEVGPVVEGVVADLEVLAAEQGVAVAAQVRDAPRVAVAESSLRRCLVVLLDNAVAHSPVDGTVHLDVTTVRRRVVVRVADEGSGLMGIAPSAVFERFSRGAAVDGAPRRGFGIGLSLVRDLAARYGGRVLVERSGANGTVMRLELPTAGR